MTQLFCQVITLWIFLLWNSYLFMTTLDMIVLLIKRIKRPNLTKQLSSLSLCHLQITLEKKRRKQNTLTKKKKLKLDLQTLNVIFVAKRGIGLPSTLLELTRTYLSLEYLLIQLLNSYSPQEYIQSAKCSWHLLISFQALISSQIVVLYHTCLLAKSISLLMQNSPMNLSLLVAITKSLQLVKVQFFSLQSSPVIG